MILVNKMIGRIKKMIATRKKTTPSKLEQQIQEFENSKSILERVNFEDAYIRRSSKDKRSILTLLTVSEYKIFLKGVADSEESTDEE